MMISANIIIFLAIADKQNKEQESHEILMDLRVLLFFFSLHLEEEVVQI